MYMPGRRRTGSRPSNTSMCLAVYPASAPEPRAGAFDLALVLPRADAFGALRADDLAVRGVSKRSGCFVGFFLVAVLAIEPFKYDRGESVARYYATMVMQT